MLKESTKVRAKKEEFTLKNKGSIRSARMIHIAEDLSWNYGEDVVIYDVRESTPFVSYYIVATASNERRLRALINAAEDALYDNYKDIDHKEGNKTSEWFLIDAKDVVIHLFTSKERERVDIDRLYEKHPHKIVKAEKEPEYRRRKKPVKETYEC